MQLSRPSVKRVILVVALAAATAAGAAPQAFALNGDPISVHHFASEASGAGVVKLPATIIGFSTVLPMINPQPLPPRKIPPCLPCSMAQQG